MKMRLEEMPLRLNSDDQDFEVDDEESDFLLQSADVSIRMMNRNKKINQCTKIFKQLLCG